MAARITPPHLAKPELSYLGADATPEEIDGFIAAIIRGFHGDYTPGELWSAFRGITEPGRNFGFRVDDRWVTTCGAYTKIMTTPGGSVPIAGVTIVTVQPSYRRRGLLTAMMNHQLSQIAADGVEPVAALWASEALIYGRFGYGHAAPRLVISGQTRSTAFRSDVDLGGGSVGELAADDARPVIEKVHAGLLPGRPGALSRNEAWWTSTLHDPETWRRGRSARRFAVHFSAAGRPDGYAMFRVKEGEGPTGPGGEVHVEEVDAASPAGYARLWRYLLDLDLVRSFRQRGANVGEPLRYFVQDLRAVKTELTDGIYVRLVDVRAALEARRYATEVDVVIGVRDPLLKQNNGAIRLQAGPDGASATRARGRGDLVLDVRELGASYLGGVSLNALHAAGLVDERVKGSVAAAATALGWARPPFCPDGF